MAQYRVPVLEQFSWQPPIMDKDLTAPPGGESKGDRYIVGAGATGDWSGEDKHIATYTGSGWLFDTPSEGWQAWVIDEDIYYVYNGTAWVAEGIATVSQAVSQVLSELTLVSAALSACESDLLVEKSTVNAVSEALVAESSQVLANSGLITAVESQVQANSGLITATESQILANSGLITSNDSAILLLESQMSQAESELATKQSAATYDSDYGVLLFEV